MVKELRGETSVRSQRSSDPEPLSPVARIVRRHDRDRFQTALFAPAGRREALFALYAFNYEIARVREVVTQPVLGRIRLEWWRETIAAAFAEAPFALAPGSRHEIAPALTAAIHRHALSRAWFDRLIDARENDFAGEPPASLAALEDYAEATSSALVYLALEVLETRDAAATQAGRHVGIAYALAGLLRALPFQPGARRPMIPADIAARTGLDRSDCEVLRCTPPLCHATAEIAVAARGHLQRARALSGAAFRRAFPALLPAILADRSLKRLKRAGYDPFDPALARPDPLQSWRLAAAALRRRF